VVTVHGLQQVPSVPDGDAVVEMETAGIVRAAAARGVPVVSLRSISDSPEAPIPLADLRPLAILGAILRTPRILRSLLRVQKNAALAARVLADAVRAVIDHPGLAGVSAERFR
jgi:hypothetical protein